MFAFKNQDFVAVEPEPGFINAADKFEEMMTNHNSGKKRGGSTKRGTVNDKSSKYEMIKK